METIISFHHIPNHYMIKDQHFADGEVPTLIPVVGDVIEAFPEPGLGRDKRLACRVKERSITFHTGVTEIHIFVEGI